MNAITEPARFTDTESEELTAYRPINRWAVVAAVLGVLSTASLLHPAFLVIPVIGAATSLIAALQLTRAASNQTGRQAMAWGLILSLLFGSCSAASAIYRQNRIRAEARQYAQSWLELFRAGRVREAHQLSLSDDGRIPPGVSLDEHYAARDSDSKSRLPGLREPHGQGGDGPGGHGDKGHEGHDHEGHDHSEENIDYDDPVAMATASPHVQLKVFQKKPIVARMLQLGNQVSYHYLGTTFEGQDGLTGIVIQQQFAARTGEKQEFIVRVTMLRRLLNRVATWSVSSVDEAKDS
jgi:hypothetical protein